jgi:hypothetical protein
MSKIGTWILEQEQLTETYQKFNHDAERNELNEKYDEYLLFGHRNYFGSLNDLVCRYEGEEQHPSTYDIRVFEEGVEQC